MSSAETLKSGRAEKGEQLPLKVTIENPNTGDITTINPMFFVGLYTRKAERIPKEGIAVGHMLKGAANTLDKIAVVKAIQEQVVPYLLEQIGSEMERRAENSSRRGAEKLDTLLSALLFGDLLQTM